MGCLMFDGIFEVSCNEVFSVVLVRLIIPLIKSFCFLRVSLLLHHVGRLYSQSRPRFRQALHRGLSSEHFFLLSRHVKQPIINQSNAYLTVELSVPERDLLCIFELLGEVALPCDCADVCSVDCAMLREVCLCACSMLQQRSNQLRNYARYIVKRGGTSLVNRKWTLN